METYSQHSSLLVSSETNSDIYLKRPETQPSSLASIYHAKKSLGNVYEPVETQNNNVNNVGALKAAFQTKIVTSSMVNATTEERRPLKREKSFEEARTAVQSQIERIFQTAAAAKAAAAAGSGNAASKGTNGVSARDSPLKLAPVVGGVPATPLHQIKPVLGATLKRELSLQVRNPFQTLSVLKEMAPN